ncbi:MAG: hypothetical protein ACTSX1_08915 [Candidatus Heimdallarchaeaceae archaeon]
MSFHSETPNESGSKQIELWIQIIRKAEKLMSSASVEEIQKVNREIKQILNKIDVFRILSIH